MSPIKVTQRPPEDQLTATAVGEVLATHDRLVERGERFPLDLSAAIEQLRQAARLETPLVLPQLMTVRVLDRSGAVTAPRTVTIPAVCPACGGPRSTDLTEAASMVHGMVMRFDCWSNPCGHVDKPAAVLMEANRFHQLVTSRIGGE